MSDEPVLEELCRRGDLSLVRSRTNGRVAVRCDGSESHPEVAMTFDRAEWAWLQHCAAPLALQVLGPEPDERVSVGEQAMLPVDAG